MRSPPNRTAVNGLGCEPVVLRFSRILLDARGRPSFGERENTVPGRVIEALTLGHAMRASLDLGDTDYETLTLCSRPTPHAAMGAWWACLAWRSPSPCCATAFT